MIDETVETEIDETPDAPDDVAAPETGDVRPSADAALPPIELTDQALEALLFVAERPLSRREIAALAGTDRETVDARLGDLLTGIHTTGDAITKAYFSSRALPAASLATQEAQQQQCG